MVMMMMEYSTSQPAATYDIRHICRSAEESRRDPSLVLLHHHDRVTNFPGSSSRFVCRDARPALGVYPLWPLWILFSCRPPVYISISLSLRLTYLAAPSPASPSKFSGRFPPLRDTDAQETLVPRPQPLEPAPPRGPSQPSVGTTGLPRRWALGLGGSSLEGTVLVGRLRGGSEYQVGRTRGLSRWALLEIAMHGMPSSRDTLPLPLALTARLREQVATGQARRRRRRVRCSLARCSKSDPLSTDKAQWPAASWNWSLAVVHAGCREMGGLISSHGGCHHQETAWGP